MAAGRKQHKHRRSKGRLSKLIQLLFVLALLAAVTVGATVFFRVEQIEVSGNSRYTGEEIVAVTGIQNGDNLFHMNKFAIRDHVLEQMPYVESILIRRRLPSTITIAVEEWDAVAQVLPNPDWTPPEVEEGEQPPVAAAESWLISVGGKLLESAPEGDPRMTLSGLTALDVRAGTQLAVPEEEAGRLDAVLTLLAELEDRGMIAEVSRMQVGSTSLVLEYKGRYDVRLPLGGDVAYQMDALLAAVADRESALGEQAEGTFDLTQKNATVLYSPRRLG